MRNLIRIFLCFTLCQNIVTHNGSQKRILRVCVCVYSHATTVSALRHTHFSGLTVFCVKNVTPDKYQPA